ncbi:type VI secretion system-associated protein TagF [Marivita hallyeonensis]|uniref:Type VI secretion system protein ImpM n=1 Tax=Marivita hallyeonensis TaxID=996342 RepID=A0A1M5PI82_9RHOB|nr:type VI secretion system-associated protein TagF [Marivita hallyeonensis]SHH01504.1 type VI secretion system protein ImpM [Marivita hallyeonensis]
MTVAAVGAFGKIPAAGDFLRIRAPSGFVQVWDEWLQKCLVSGSHTFGSHWESLYMSVPIWRFCLSAGLAGPQRIMGVLMPSVDRVGRRFPLTLMAVLPENGSVLLDHFSRDDMFAAMEDLALATLEDDASRAILEDGLSGLNTDVSGFDASIAKTANALVLRHSHGSNLTPSILASDCLSPTFQAPSIWSAVMEGDVRLMLCDGLPDGSNMQGLFDLDADIWKADPA